MSFQASRMNTILSGLRCTQPYGEKVIAEVQLLITPDAMEYFFQPLRITHNIVPCIELLKCRAISSDFVPRGYFGIISELLPLLLSWPILLLDFHQ